jgi:hypothetical protein
MWKDTYVRRQDSCTVKVYRVWYQIACRGNWSLGLDIDVAVVITSIGSAMLFLGLLLAFLHLVEGTAGGMTHVPDERKREFKLGGKFKVGKISQSNVLGRE